MAGENAGSLLAQSQWVYVSGVISGSESTGLRYVKLVLFNRDIIVIIIITLINIWQRLPAINVYWLKEAD